MDKLRKTIDQARQADLPAVWRSYGLPLRQAKNGHGYASPWSPCCGHATRHDATSLFVSKTNTWRWHCFRCGSGGTAIDLVMAIDKVDEMRAAERLCEQRFGGGRSVTLAPPIQRAGSTVDPTVIERVIARLREALQGRLDLDLCAALQARGIKAQTVLDASEQGVLLTLPALPARAEATLRVMVGTDLLTEAGMLRGKWTAAAFRPLVVLSEGNRMVEFRRVGDGEGPKALQYGESAPVVLRQDADGPDVKYVVVVEGIIDALSVAQMATKRHSVIVALLGAAKSRAEWWTGLAIRYPNATWLVATDADQAGDEAAERILASLPAGVPSKRMRPPSPAKDWNDVLCAKEGVSAAPAVTVAA